jgi:membrane protein YdbS with pleckstrin-like domain
MIFIKPGYALAVVAGVALVFLLATLGLSASISIPLALALLLIPAYYHIRRNMVRYTVTDSKLQIDTGLVARTTRNIPLSKVQDVTVSATIPQRLLGFGDVIVDNASDLGGQTVMHNINSPATTLTFFCGNYDAGIKLIPVEGTSKPKRVLNRVCTGQAPGVLRLRLIKPLIIAVFVSVFAGFSANAQGLPPAVDTNPTDVPALVQASA